MAVLHRRLDVGVFHTVLNHFRIRTSENMIVACPCRKAWNAPLAIASHSTNRMQHFSPYAIRTKALPFRLAKSNP
jgi:hypothetical protein